jgi:hypothetical protein
MCIAVHTAHVSLPRGGVRRKPARPPEFRFGDFAAQFDDGTLFYDAFWRREPDELVLLGPSLGNLKAFFDRMVVTAEPCGSPCRFRIREMDRHSQILVRPPGRAEQIVLRTPVGTFEIRPQFDLNGLFAHQRVLFTLSKNNRLEWIQDWIRYHRDLHGVTAVLFYDNASTDYSIDELAAALNAIEGLKQKCIVAWPFKYGPQGIGARQFWDSDFCQYGAWEHARGRFLRDACSALNCDVDELVVSESGHSVLDVVEKSYLGIVRFHGVWVSGIQGLTRCETDGPPITFRDFTHFSSPRRRGALPADLRTAQWCPTKWAVVPSRCPAYTQWAPHTIKRWPSALLTTREFNYRHFREINNGWKYDRSDRDVFDPRVHVYDRKLVAGFSRVRWDG